MGKFINKDEFKRLAKDGKINIEDIIGDKVIDKDEHPLDFKLSDDEFIMVLDAINNRQIPIAALDEFLPYKHKRKADGSFLGLSGGFYERAKRLGMCLTFSTFEDVSGEPYIKINCRNMAPEEVEEFMKKRRERAYKVKRRTSGSFKRIFCDVCGCRVQVGLVDGEFIICCNCDDKPSEGLNISESIDKERKDKWK